jgi:hypothetical protein
MAKEISGEAVYQVRELPETFDELRQEVPAYGRGPGMNVIEEVRDLVAEQALDIKQEICPGAIEFVDVWRVADREAFWAGAPPGWTESRDRVAELNREHDERLREEARARHQAQGAKVALMHAAVGHRIDGRNARRIIENLATLGYKIVAREPTEAMLRAMGERTGWSGLAAEGWRAAWDAAE